jgi:arylsulfatase A
MKRFTTLLSIFFAISVEARASEKPNVVIIMADDIGFECYGASGSEYYSTPNIDRLAATGVRFTQAYSQPICTPSRVKIMTGRYNFRNYTRFGELDLSQPTFAKMVKSAGYATAIAGKWQLSAGNLNGPHEAGFDEFCLWHFSKGSSGGKPLDPMFKQKGSRYKSPHLFKNGKLIPSTENKYGPDIVSDFVCDFIERKQNQPFLVYYPMILVHNPFDPTPESVDWEKRDRSRKANDHFREMVHYMDKAIGKIVVKLEETGLRENTLILVTGDNGTNTAITSPFPGRGPIKGGKGLMADAGNRVAFVANWPGHIDTNSVVDSLIDFADVMPTVAEVTGAALPKGTDGKSFLPLLRGDESDARGWVFMSYSRNGLSQSPFRCFVRDERWKLYADGSLFNVPEDWLEQKPVVGSKNAEVRKRLQPILDRILRDAPDEHIRRKPVTAKRSRKN